MESEKFQPVTDSNVFEIKGAFIIEKTKSKQWISKSNKLTKIPSQIMVFETYLLALNFCLENKYHRPKGYKITTKDQLELPIK